MTLSRCLWLLLLAPFIASPQDPLLARVKSRAVENLKRAPNYTCALAVERMWRAPASHRFNPVDRLRLEVALSDGKELFAWPGSDKFGEVSLEQLVPSGTTASGHFASLVSNIFLYPLASLASAGETVLDGTRAIRYSYFVPTGYTIRTESGSATVGYHGSLFVDAQTLDLLRLEAVADGIPPALQLSEALDAIRYQRVKVGESDFLLPVSSELQVTSSAGMTNRNLTQFSGCRQFIGQSAISFGEPGPPAALPAPRSVAEVTLTSGLALDLRLETEIDSLTAAIGDPVTARLATDVKNGGRVVVPKGALASGRVTRFQRDSRTIETPQRFPFYSIGLRFFTLEFGDSRAEFNAWLADLGPTPGFRAPQQTNEPLSGLPGKQAILLDQPWEPLPGLGMFLVAGERVHLPRGFRMRWQTGEAP
jgi:hypothetical protein